jgi:hypothetical protein
LKATTEKPWPTSTYGRVTLRNPALEPYGSIRKKSTNGAVSVGTCLAMTSPTRMRPELHEEVDLAIPRITTAKFGVVEPNLNAGGAKRLGNAFRGRRVLGCGA